MDAKTARETSVTKQALVANNICDTCCPPMGSAKAHVEDCDAMNRQQLVNLLTFRSVKHVNRSRSDGALPRPS